MESRCSNSSMTFPSYESNNTLPGINLAAGYWFNILKLGKALMKRLASFVVALALCAPAFPIQDQTSSSTSSSGGSSAASSPTTTQAQQDSQQAQDDKDKSKKKDKKKKKKDKESVDDVTAPATFSDAVAQSVLQQLTDGLEGHSDRLMLSAFDDNKMDGYLSFEDQVLAFFQRYDSFRVHFRISQATTEGSKGVVLVDIEMEEIPRSASAQPVRKRDQMRFEMERGKKGWKIVDLRPRGFFS